MAKELEALQAQLEQHKAEKEAALAAQQEQHAAALAAQKAAAEAASNEAAAQLDSELAAAADAAGKQLQEAQAAAEAKQAAVVAEMQGVAAKEHKQVSALLQEAVGQLQRLKLEQHEDSEKMARWARGLSSCMCTLAFPRCATLPASAGMLLCMTLVGMFIHLMRLSCTVACYLHSPLLLNYGVLCL